MISTSGGHGDLLARDETAAGGADRLIRRAPVSTTISIIVIGRDEGERAERAVRSAFRALAELEPAARDASEVIFVDSGSIDDSPELAARAGAEVVRIPRDGASAARARNAGLRVARGRWVHFVDGDMEVCEGWLPIALESAENEQLDAVAGRIVEREEGATIWTRMFGHDWSASGARGADIGGAGLWKRATLCALGGYDESLIVGEDPDLCRRALAAGYRTAARDEDMVIHELGLEGPLGWYRRAVAVGRSAAWTALNHGDPRLVWQRFGQPLVFAALAVALVAVFGAQGLAVIGAGAAALITRRAWIDRSRGLSTLDAFAHGAHVYAVKVPQLVGGVQTLLSRMR